MTALEKTLRYVVLACVFALPFLALYVSTSLFFPFITGKNFAFRILVEIAVGAWVPLALINPAYRLRRSWLLFAFITLALILAIADATGVYPFKSFWSNYERMEGWVTIIHLLAYFAVASSILNTERLWKAWWHTSLAVSAYVALIGVSQLLGWTQINQGNTRVDARLGNATYAAIYMLFHVFVAMMFWARAWVEKRSERVRYSLLYGPVILLDASILFFTATRGAILGLAGGIAVAALILIGIAPRSRVAWRAGVIVCGLLVLGGGLWLARDTALVQRSEPLRRLTTIASEGYPLARRLNVEMAWQGFKERPILGWGQENYAAVFDEHYDPRMYAQEQWFDRTHNIIFDWLIAGGILGLLAYLSLHLFALLAVWRSGAFAPYERALLTGLFAGYFFYLVFTFDNITSYLLFVSVLAYIAVRAQSAKAAPERAPLIQPKFLPILAALALILTWGTAWYVNASMIGANRTLIAAISPQAGGISQNLALFKKALAYPRAGTQEIREQLAQAAMSVLGSEDAPDAVKQQFAQLAVEEMTKQSAEAPENARGPFFLGLLLDRAGIFADAKTALAEARERSPRKQGIIFEQGFNAFARGADDEAVSFFREAYELAPAYGEARISYAAALIRTGKEEEAEALIANDVATGVAADQRIWAAYAARKDYDAIISIWTAAIAARPQDADVRMVLADAYYSKGDAARSIQVLQDAKRDIPAVADQADALIRQIQGGAGQ